MKTQEYFIISFNIILKIYLIIEKNYYQKYLIFIIILFLIDILGQKFQKNKEKITFYGEIKEKEMFVFITIQEKQIAIAFNVRIRFI